MSSTKEPVTFIALRGGLWIFSGTTHYTYQREAVDGKKSFKILQAKQPCYKKDKRKLWCFPSEFSLATDWVNSTTDFCNHYFSRITFMLYCLFCRNKMLQKGNGTCPPVKRFIGFQPRCPYEKAWQGWKELITFQLLGGSTHKPQ